MYCNSYEIDYGYMKEFANCTKGQLISKKIVKARILQKNERMNSFLLESV